MDLIVTGYGKKVYKNREVIVVEKILKKEIELKEFSIHDIETIILNKYTSITGGAIQLALKNEVDIMIMDKYGNPYGKFWVNRFGSSGKIRINQLKIQDKTIGLELAKEFIIQKIMNQMEHLNHIYRRRKKKNNSLISFNKKIKSYADKIRDADLEDKESIRGYEGNAARLYYKGLNTILPDRYKFKKRSLHPGADEVNTLLNYGFGILYSKIERAAIIAGMDPAIGFFHRSGYNKKPLVYDIIEKYRYIVFRAVFKAFSSKKVSNRWFNIKANKIFLAEDGKKEFVRVFYKEYNRYYLYHEKKHKIKEIIQLDCHHLAKTILNLQLD